MRWIEVTLETDGEAAEAVAEVLRRYGHQGVAIEQVGFHMQTWEDEVPPPERLAVRAYFPEDERAESVKAQLEAALYQLHRLYQAVPTAPRYRVIDEQDWAEAWKANYHPVRIGKRILVRPLWIDVEGAPDEVVIALDPGMAFGTGTHPSTQLMLEATEALMPALRGAHVLDLGCGSGILAIGAAKLGAGSVRALDTDPMAVRITLENAAANGVAHQISAEVGSLEQLLANGERFDLALVNILAKVIVAMCDQRLGEVIKPNGIGVFGGIIREQVEEVEAALVRTGLTPYKRRTSGDWVAIEARRAV
ncbi:MAG: 50S ribosomal protein L11 methyltransferase [Chloroflexi bacterium]|jgi:ribosomal protein L11 methyltransferase|nr:50S ribosomal protein L11 methyltransferase [Chloroflexota bacterium]